MFYGFTGLMSKHGDLQKMRKIFSAVSDAPWQASPAFLASLDEFIGDKKKVVPGASWGYETINKRKPQRTAGAGKKKWTNF